MITADDAVKWHEGLESYLHDALSQSRAAREVLKKLQGRIAQLEEALTEALGFVRPEVDDLVKEYSDLDGTDHQTRERCERIRTTRERLTHVLEGMGCGSG